MQVFLERDFGQGQTEFLLSTQLIQFIVFSIYLHGKFGLALCRRKLSLAPVDVRLLRWRRLLTPIEILGRARAFRAHKMPITFLNHVVEFTDWAAVLAPDRGAVRSLRALSRHMESLPGGARLHQLVQRQLSQTILTEQQRFRM